MFSCPKSYSCSGGLPCVEGQKSTELWKGITYTIHISNTNLNLIQLNPDRSHPHRKLVATIHHPFSAPIARGKKSSTILARIWRVFYGRLLFSCHRLLPQLLCHLPGSSQRNSNYFIASASPDLLLLITQNAAQEFPL